MKRLIYIFVLLLLPILLISTVYAKDTEENFEDCALDINTEKELIDDYKNKMINSGLQTEEIVYQYYGTYNDAIVVWISYVPNGGEELTYEIILGDYSFWFSMIADAECFYVYKDGVFIPIKDAYDAGLLCDEDIEKIAEDFTIPVNSNAFAYKVRIPYTDVNIVDWFYFYVDEMYVTNIMSGLNFNTFGPYENLSRAQFATILSRMEELQSIPYNDIFKDVADGEWYTDAVLWAAENEIVNGYENGYFGPADYITREQMATMLYRYAKYKGYDTADKADLTEYPDMDDVSVFAKDAVSWCVAEGIISGNDGKLLPQGDTTRAECAAMITRFVNLYE